MLEAVPAARRTASFAGIEAERASRITALLRERLASEEFADRVERADIAGGIRPRGAADRRLVHHHHVFDLLVAGDGAMTARGFVGFVFQFAERVVENILNQRGFPRAADAGDADQPVQRNLDIDVLQVVLAGAQES